MILEEVSFKKFGYYPSALKLKSHKRILVVCEDCGKIREISKSDYRALCKSCALKGNINGLGYKHTEEAKNKIGAASKGENHPNFGKHLSEKTKALISTKHKGKILTEGHKAKIRIALKGKKNPNYKCGRRASFGRRNAKRKQLGYTLLMPLAEGEAGHHVTNEYVIGVPAGVHNSIGGNRKKHRTRVLQWLKANDKYKYKMVLCVLAKELSIYGSKY